MGSLYKIYMVLLINFTVMQNSANLLTTDRLEALKFFMSRDEQISSVVPTDDTPAVVRPQPFILRANPRAVPAQPAFPQPTYEMVFPTSPKPTPPKGGSTVQPESLHVHHKPTLVESVRQKVCGLVIRPIQVITFCLAFVGFGFPESAVSALLTKNGLTSEKNGNVMVDIKGMMNQNIDQFVKSLVQMKENVEFILAVIHSLKKKPIYWTMFLNPHSKNDYIHTSIPKHVLQSVRKCLTTIGFPEGNEEMKVPSNLASLSESQLLEHIWTVVSNYDWESAPQKPAPQKPAKRGREEEQPDNAPSAKREALSNEQIIKTILTRIMKALLSGVDSVSLHEIFQSDFLDLSQDRLRQVMDFLSNTDNIWCLHRILMEMKKLNVFSERDDVVLSRGDGFNFEGFNPKTIETDFKRLFLESIMMHQSACQERHEEFLQEEVRKMQEKTRINRFKTSLFNLWNTKDMCAFFQELIAVCPEFNSFTTNWGLLENVVYEFMKSIYNSTTRAYHHNREPCENPLQDFLQYATKRGVFSRKAPEREIIRVCEYSSDNCPFGSKCSGVHQCFISSGWNTERFWGKCCSEYSERRTCSNRNCHFAHFTGDEYERAFKNGGKDSNRMRNDLLAKAYIANIEKDI